MIVKKIRQSIVWILLLFLLAVNVRLARQFPVSAAGETLTIAAPVVFSAGYSISSAQFIDSANSTYFLDPAATVISLVTAGAATVSGTIESTTGGFKFPDGTTQTSAASAIPAGLVSFFNLASCPTGWTELTAARGRYMVGLPLSGTLAGTSGTALTNLESRPVGQHSHGISDPGHSHSARFPDGGVGCGEDIWQKGAQCGYATWTSYAAVTNITINSTGSVAGTNAPYIQLLACQKS